MPPARMPRRGLPLRVATVASAAVLIAITWAFTIGSMRSAERSLEAHAQSNLANLAVAIEWQLDRQLQTVGEAMRGLVMRWTADPAHFDAAGARGKSSVLGEASMRIALLDANGIVLTSTQRGQQGADLSGRADFAAHRAHPHDGLLVAPAIAWRESGKWEIVLSRGLWAEDGRFAGAILVGYDPWVLSSLLEQVDVGPRGLIALVGDDATIRILVTPSDNGLSQEISRTPMFQAIGGHPRGTWRGRSAPDGVERVHAFRRVADQHLTILVGMDTEVALRDAMVWGVTARSFASSITMAIGLTAWLIMLVLNEGVRREERLAADRAILEAAAADAQASNERTIARTAQLEAILAGMSDGVMVLDADLNLVMWNERFPLYTGLSAEALRVGVSMEQMLRLQAEAGEFGPVDVEKAILDRMNTIRAGETGRYDVRARPNGRGLEWRRNVLPDGGFVTLYTDITARMQTEEARERAHRVAEQVATQKADFVSIVSHEIRTPLNAVVGSLTLLDQSGLSPGQRRLANTARQAGDALLDLVNDVLEMSSMEAGALTLRPVVFDVRHMLAGVVDMFAPAAAARDVWMAAEIDPALPRLLSADAGRIRQVLMNFAANAVKFSRPGAVTVIATTTASTASPDGKLAVRFGVRDQGPLISASEAASLFRPFSRLESARATGSPGTGLGLAICDRLAQLMGGTIGLRAVGEAGAEGNEFWTVLPMEAAPSAPGCILLTPRSRRALVLLVEDVAANHMVCASMLRRAGHHVEVAESGAEALRLVALYPFDLIFMDLAMPGMGGIEAAAHIRGLAGPAGKVPIVALTATTAPEDRLRCLEAGMDSVVGKPVRPAALLAAVRDFATGSPTRATRRAPVPRQQGPPPETAHSEAARSEAAYSGTADSPLDQVRLAELRDALPGNDLKRLMQSCLDEMRRLLPALATSIEGFDRPAIAAQAHAVAGLAATYGIVQVERLAREIMETARADDGAGARRLIVSAEAEFARAEEALGSAAWRSAA